MFGVDRETISTYVKKVRKILTNNFVPKYIGFGKQHNITAERVVSPEFSTYFAQEIGEKIYHKPIAFSPDGSYIPIEKFGGFEGQLYVWSTHKHYALSKVMHITAMRGYTLELLVNFGGGGQASDRVLWPKYIRSCERELKKNPEIRNIISFFYPDDWKQRIEDKSMEPKYAAICDQGFGDSDQYFQMIKPQKKRTFVNDDGKSEPEKQLTAEQAAQNRVLTSNRHSVERMQKQGFKNDKTFANHKIHWTQVPVAGEDARILCAKRNMLYGTLDEHKRDMDESDLETIFSRMNHVSELQPLLDRPASRAFKFKAVNIKTITTIADYDIPDLRKISTSMFAIIKSEQYIEQPRQRGTTIKFYKAELSKRMSKDTVLIRMNGLKQQFKKVFLKYFETQGNFPTLFQRLCYLRILT